MDFRSALRLALLLPALAFRHDREGQERISGVSEFGTTPRRGVCKFAEDGSPFDCIYEGEKGWLEDRDMVKKKDIKCYQKPGYPDQLFCCLKGFSYRRFWALQSGRKVSKENTWMCCSGKSSKAIDPPMYYCK
ncbi:unnamed protein product [Durusdinium trenchii]|uniref:Uncharacterized protein n=2 Tax=Durusdinium trenchii TaxID=1381693 RepID=A0ABP0MQ36_9DINO